MYIRIVDDVYIPSGGARGSYAPYCVYRATAVAVAAGAFDETDGAATVMTPAIQLNGHSNSDEKKATAAVAFLLVVIAEEHNPRRRARGKNVQ